MTPNQPTFEQLEVLTADIYEAVFNGGDVRPLLQELSVAICDTRLASDYISAIRLYKRLDDMVMAHAVEERTDTPKAGPRITVVNIADLIESLRTGKLL